MKVRLLTSRSGAGGSNAVGDVIEVGREEALRLIERGQAEPVRETPAPERAVRAPGRGRGAKRG